MEETKVFTQEQKAESLRKVLIEAGYDMALSQVESMEEDMIGGKTNPKSFGIRYHKTKSAAFSRCIAKSCNIINC